MAHAFSFYAYRMLPYRYILMYNPIASVICLCPFIIHAQPLD